ncbi:MAG: hypothetical protein AABX11_02345 [Nanoarchaeota archaeon]
MNWNKALVLGALGFSFVTGIIIGDRVRYLAINKANESSYSLGYHQGVRDSVPTHIFSEEVNKDGIKDLVVYSRAYTNGSAIYIGSTNGTFESFDEYKEKVLREYKFKVENLEAELNSIQRKVGSGIYESKLRENMKEPSEWQAIERPESGGKR